MRSARTSNLSHPNERDPYVGVASCQKDSSVVVIPIAAEETNCKTLKHNPSHVYRQFLGQPEIRPKINIWVSGQGFFSIKPARQFITPNPQPHASTSMPCFQVVRYLQTTSRSQDIQQKCLRLSGHQRPHSLWTCKFPSGHPNRNQ